MKDRYRLEELRDDQLLAALSAIVGRGNQVTADLLAHLAELDERQLCAELGFPSLWAYCVESLGLCESSAGRRIAAARVCRQFPEAFALVATGGLHISALCSLKPYVNGENATELFELCRGKSAAREVYRREGRQCTFVSKDGRRCGSRRFLELDHILPWAMGGEPTVENLRVRCAAHNRLAARHCFGKGYLRAAASKRSRRGQPEARADDPM